MSFGVTSAGQREEMLDVLRRADGALLTAKRQGRDRVVLCDASGVIVPLDEDEERARRLDPAFDMQPAAEPG